MVANGTEGEPASSKDRVLLERSPHLVVDGVLVASRLVDADEAVIAVGRQARDARSSLVAAVADRADAGAIRIIDVPDRFVAGEESALVSFLGGGEARPTVTPPRPSHRGLRGRPTLVQNVETLAGLALLARRGAAGYRAGETFLATVRGAVRDPGVLELGPATTFAQLFAAAGGLTAELQAVLVGGYFGTWLPARGLERLRLTREDLAPFGASPGARTVIALPVGADGLAETARITRYLAGESAGQCGPCVFGLPAVADCLDDVVRGGAARTAALERLPRLRAQIAGRGACHLPDGVVRLVESALRAFLP